MKLSEKGRFAPPPKLPVHAEAVSRALASWPEVHARTHWELGNESIVDGADFYVGEEEIGHLHLYSEAHVATGAKLGKALIGAKLAAPFPWSAKFVVFRVAKSADVERALWLFGLAYDRVRGVTLEELVRRVEAVAQGAA